MARERKPSPDESLADFLAAMQDDMETNRLGVLLQKAADPTGTDTKRATSVKNFQRNIRRWRGGDPAALEEESARLLSQVLNADFSSFVAPPTPKKNGLSQQVAELSTAVTSLQDALNAFGSRLDALERHLAT